MCRLKKAAGRGECLFCLFSWTQFAATKDRTRQAVWTLKHILLRSCVQVAGGQQQPLAMPCGHTEVRRRRLPGARVGGLLDCRGSSQLCFNDTLLE